MVTSIVFSMLIFFIGKYLSTATEDIKFVVGALQPLAWFLIVSYTIDDMGEKSLEKTRMSLQYNVDVARAMSAGAKK